jgi:hypothetical protein
VQISLSLSPFLPSLAWPRFLGFSKPCKLHVKCEVWPQFFTTCSEMICREREREIKGSWNHWNPSVPKLSRVLTINHLGKKLL